MADDPPVGLADRLCLACQGLSCARVGLMTDTHPETVRRYLKTGKVSPRFLSAMCGSLDLSAEWLLNGIGPMKKNHVRAACLMEATPLEIYQALGLSLDHVLRFIRGSAVPQRDASLNGHGESGGTSNGLDGNGGQA